MTKVSFYNYWIITDNYSDLMINAKPIFKLHSGESIELRSNY